MPVGTKRIHDPPSHGDGYRVLIDGIWPRGITRERAAVDQWARELAPSAQLRRWYGHEPERFDAEHSNATVLGDVLRRGLR